MVRAFVRLTHDRRYGARWCVDFADRRERSRRHDAPPSERREREPQRHADGEAIPGKPPPIMESESLMAGSMESDQPRSVRATSTSVGALSGRAIIEGHRAPREPPPASPARCVAPRPIQPGHRAHRTHARADPESRRGRATARPDIAHACSPARLRRLTQDLEVPKRGVVSKVVCNEFVERAACGVLNHSLGTDHDALEIDTHITQRAAPPLRRAHASAV